jgi:hypothetical protein
VPRPREPLPAAALALVTLLLALHAWLALSAAREQGITSDEIAHLVAGHAYHVRGDFRLHPENGLLPQRLAGLPLTLGGAPLPPTSLPSWRHADVWRYGHTALYGQGLATDQWLLLGRAMITLSSVATGLLVFLWSRALFGARGALLSLLLFTFCPTFLAHGALATSDVVMTFCFLASVGAWWRHLGQPGPGWAGLSAFTLGVAATAKFSAVLLPPMLLLIGVVWAAGEAARMGWRTPLLRVGRSLLVHGLAAWVVIWVSYGCRFSAFAPELAAGATFSHGWDAMLAGLGGTGTILAWLRDVHALPEAWLYGLTFVLQFARARGAFLSGEYSITGWVTFFPFAFAVKSTLPFLLLVAGGMAAGTAAAFRLRAAAGWRALAARLRPLIPLAVLFVIYWAMSLASHLNIGHRHILPTYPVLFIAAGWLGRFLDRRHLLAALALCGLLGWHAAESLRARPNYLAYFNALVGGSSQGWRHLVDSSLDWGQSLPGLGRWLNAHAGTEPVHLAYFGTGDPAYEGIRATLLPSLPEVGEPRPWRGLRPGVYAISATMLQHVYSPIQGPWTGAHEAEFQRLRSIEPVLLSYHDDPARRRALQAQAPAAQWEQSWKRYELLRFARLCHYLRVRPADAVIGHAIRVFRLNATELAAATGESIQDWSRALESAAGRQATGLSPLP